MQALQRGERACTCEEHFPTHPSLPRPALRRVPDDSHPLFLRRNVPALRPSSPPESAAAAEGKGGAYLADGVGDDVMAQELLQYLLCNGLECKISTTTSRVRGEEGAGDRGG